MSPLDVYDSVYNAKLFPLRKPKGDNDEDSKKPLKEENWREAEYDKDAISNFWSKGHPIGWCLEAGHLVVDVDVATEQRPDKQGEYSLLKLENLIGKPLSEVAIEVQAPAGGRHFYLSKPVGFKVRKSIKEFPGIDFLSEGQYVVTCGSPHWQGGHYTFGPTVDLIGDYQLRKAPQTLLQMVGRQSKTPVLCESPKKSAELLDRLLSCLNAEAFSSNELWQPILMGSHHFTGGSPEGLAAFTQWSLLDGKYADASEDIRARWSSLDLEGTDYVTVATLYNEVENVGRADLVTQVKTIIAFEEAEEAGEAGAEVQAPQIEYVKNDMYVNDQLIALLADSPNIFQRANSLVTIRGGGVRELEPLSICEMASSLCHLGEYKMTKKGRKWEEIRVPARVGKQIQARGSWYGIRKLKLVTPIPVMTSEGVLQKPGYDVATGVYYHQTTRYPQVPKQPTKDQAVNAARFLLDFVCDFPFLDESHKSAWLAALLAIIGRPAIDGPVPLTFIDANKAGAGKGLLCDVIYQGLYGCNMPKAPSVPEKEDEMIKVLTGIAVRNPPTHCFDNIRSGASFGSPSLDSVLTTGSVTGRILGGSHIGDYPIDTCFFASGNRVVMAKGSDICRRLNFIQLLSPEENPESRSGFKHGQTEILKKKVRAARKDFVAAALTVLQYGRTNPAQESLTSWGSYEAFTSVVRNAIVAVDLPDPRMSREAIDAGSSVFDESDTIVKAVEAIGATAASPKTAREIVELLERERVAEKLNGDEPVASVALDLLVPASANNKAVICGRRLSSRYVNQTVSGRWITSSVGARKTTLFWVEEV